MGYPIIGRYTSVRLLDYSTDLGEIKSDTYEDIVFTRFFGLYLL